MVLNTDLQVNIYLYLNIKYLFMFMYISEFTFVKYRIVNIVTNIVF